MIGARRSPRLSASSPSTRRLSRPERRSEPTSPPNPDAARHPTVVREAALSSSPWGTGSIGHGAAGRATRLLLDRKVFSLPLSGVPALPKMLPAKAEGAEGGVSSTSVSISSTGDWRGANASAEGQGSPRCGSLRPYARAPTTTVDPVGPAVRSQSAKRPKATITAIDEIVGIPTFRRLPIAANYPKVVVDQRSKA